jgi:tetratricopeptide (TPR) repeat protein
MTGSGRLLSLTMAACLTSGATYAVRENTHEEFRAAMRQARDGDLQADWNKMVDARERFSAFAADKELSPLAHYYLGYTDWRLSSLVFVAVGATAQASLLERAVAALEVAIEKRPQFPEAQALLATCLASWAFTDASRRDELIPRIRPAWQAAWPAGEKSPRVMLLRAISLTYAPPPYGNREKGIELWRQAIQAFHTDRPESLMPDWGNVESVAWLGGVQLAADQHAEAVELLERAVSMRPDFWWAGKAALPIARRPIAAQRER